MIRWLRLGVREMYLTRIFLNKRRREAVRLLASPQRMHAAVLSAFPPTEEVSEGRVLWRVDRYPDRTALFVVSPNEPDMSDLVMQAGWQTGEMWQTRLYRPLLNSLEIGQRWAFRLTANPTYSGRREGWADTKPRGHTTVKQQEQWLLDRCARWGFSVPDGPADSRGFRISDRHTVRFRRGNAQVVLATATFEGLLEVGDADALRRTLVDGVGRGKAYGCGLLTLAPTVEH